MELTILLFSKKCTSHETAQLLLMARRKDIRVRSLEKVGSVDGGDGAVSSEFVIPLEGVEAAVDIDFDSRNDTVFWVDNDAKLVARATLNGSTQTLVMASNLGKFLTKYIYFLNYIKNK